MKNFTVIGYWDDDTPIPCGVIEGNHEVTGGDGAGDRGPWAIDIVAVDAEAAEEEAIIEMGVGYSDEESEASR
jgi:hypothetical protein